MKKPRGSPQPDLFSWCVARNSRDGEDPERVTFHSHHTHASHTIRAEDRLDTQDSHGAVIDPASQSIRALVGRVTLSSRDHLFLVGLDTGERKDKTVAFDGTAFAYFDNPLDAVERAGWPPGSVLVFENSACSFSPSLRAAFYGAIQSRGLRAHPVNPRHTKNRRADWGIDKSDEGDAATLWAIGVEGKIPRAPWRPDYAGNLSDDPLIRARQIGYALDHPQFPADLREALATVTAHRPPPCALVAGVARETGNGRLWVDPPGYRLLTPVAAAMRSRGTWRGVKRIVRARGIYRSNLMWHPLRNLPTPQDRKAVMRAQEDFIAWCMDKLSNGEGARD